MVRKRSDLGTHLWKWRLDHGMSLTQAAEKIGVPTVTYYSWESDIALPTQKRNVRKLVDGIEGMTPYKLSQLVNSSADATPKPIDTWSGYLAKWRMDNLYTYEQAAEAMGVNSRTYGAWERDGQYPTKMENIRKVVQTLNITPEKFHRLCENRR